MKTLSIIFPCFNEAKSIPFIFDELEKKVLRDDIEIIFIDNGSTDNTKYLLEKLTANHDFARMFSLQENKGYGYGIQYGLDRATAEPFLHKTAAQSPQFATMMRRCEGSTTKARAVAPASGDASFLDAAEQ